MPKQNTQRAVPLKIKVETIPVVEEKNEEQKPANDIENLAKNTKDKPVSFFTRFLRYIFGNGD